MTAQQQEPTMREERDCWNLAVSTRPHYPPCDFPDNPCSCGAAEDRYAIAAAVRELLERRGVRELAYHLAWVNNHDERADAIADALLAARRHVPDGGEDAARVGRLADPERLARFFHDSYERLAPSFGYETRRESAVPWEEVPEANRRLMTAVCAELAQLIRRALDGDDTGSGQ